MAEKPTIARGVVSFATTPGDDPEDALLTAFAVTTDGVTFFDRSNQGRPTGPFELSVPPDPSVQLTSGHLVLASLPAAPSDAFDGISLRLDTDQLVLRVTQATAFAAGGATSFRDLDLTITQTKGLAPIAVAGHVTLHLLGDDLPLVPTLNGNTLRFVAEASTPTIDLGAADLELRELTVGVADDPWRDLIVLHTFDGLSTARYRDQAGLQDDDEARPGLDLVPKKPKGRGIERLGGRGVKLTGAGPLIDADDAESARTALVDRCSSAGELSVVAWIKPAVENVQGALPRRIVTLSRNESQRNFTLGQGVQNHRDAYAGRVRAGEMHNGERNSVSTVRTGGDAADTGRVKPVVLTAKTGTGPNGDLLRARLYVDGVDATNETESLHDVTGGFNTWNRGSQYRFLLGDELNGDRSWAGEIHRVALYARELTAPEVRDLSVARTAIEARVVIDNAPAPLDQPIPATFSPATGDLEAVVDQPFVIGDGLVLERLSLSWPGDGSDPTHEARLRVLGSDPLDFDVELSPSPVLRLRQPTTLTITDDDTASQPTRLGSLSLTSLSVVVDDTGDPAWTIRGQMPDGTAGATLTLADIPAPLAGPLPTVVQLVDGRVQLAVRPPEPTALVGSWALDHADLRFDKPTGRWEAAADDQDGGSGVSIAPLGRDLTLQVRRETDGTVNRLVLETPEGHAVTPDPGHLTLSRFALRSDTDPNRPWLLTLNGDLVFGEPASDVTTDVEPATLTFGSVNAALEATGAARRLSGRATLTVDEHQVYDGALSLSGHTLAITGGAIALFPDWAQPQLTADLDLSIEGGQAAGLVTSEPPTIEVEATLPGHDLRAVEVGVVATELVVRGDWPGQGPEPQQLMARMRHGELLLFGDMTVPVPAHHPLPGLTDSSGAVLAPASTMTGTIPLTWRPEWHPTGFQGNVGATITYPTTAAGGDPGGEPVSADVVTRLYNHPTAPSELLGAVMAELERTGAERFGIAGRHTADYELTVRDAIGETPAQPWISLRRTDRATGAVTTVMPALLSADHQVTSANSAPVFTFSQSGAVSELTIDLPEHPDPAEVRSHYDDLLTALVAGPALQPGAWDLLRQRIAERLPLPYDQLLAYHYGWDPAAGRVDLQVGMRLRVDVEHYQFVQASDTSARRGPTDGASFHLHVNAYDGPGSSPGTSGRRLGFGPAPAGLNTRSARANDDTAALIDLANPAFRRSHYRLVQPAGTSENPAGSALLVGADDPTKLAAATAAVDQASPDVPPGAVHLPLRGRVVVVPEIQVHVGSEPVWVPLGTTIRQVAERQGQPPPVGLAGQVDLGHVAGRSRPRRLVHEGVDSRPSHRFIDTGSYHSANGSDPFDLPLVKGDRLQF